MKTPAQFQKEYRQRHAERHERMKLALRRIIERLADNEKALAIELREIAQEGLA